MRADKLITTQLVLGLQSGDYHEAIREMRCVKPPLADIQRDSRPVILRGNEAKAFGIFRDEDQVRLTEFLAYDHEILREYIGETQFVQMAQSYFAAHPSQHPNARWYSVHLAEYLRTYEPFLHHPEIQELAALALALNFAFDAPEAASMSLAQMTAFDPEIFSSMILGIHPSMSRLTFKQNTTSIWSALKCETQPPRPHLLDEEQQILVWRQGTASRFRLLGNEEAMAFDACKTGASFSTMCEMIAFMDSPETAAARSASYLRGWIEAELLLAAPAFAVRLEK